MSGRINIVPVGTSLLTNFDRGNKPAKVVTEALLPANFSKDNEGKKVAVELRSTCDERGVLDLRALLHHSPARSDEALHRLSGLGVQYCAEWAGLAARDAPVTDDEVLLFVASDTDDGLRAAVLVAAHYAYSTGRPVQYVDDPSAPSALSSAFTPGTIVVVRIPRLDLDPLNNNRPDDNTWLGIGDLGAAIARKANVATSPPEVVFHLSGGYKALLPHFLVVADGVQSVVRGTFGESALCVRAQVLHESSNAPVALPIRWLYAHSLTRVEGLVREVGHGVDVDAAARPTFRGTYLEDAEHNGRRRLTPVGMIMVRTLWARK
jgi:hypothetical protein